MIICTRCLKHFNFERYLKQHERLCPNEVQKENIIDQLKTTGGYYKEIKKRHIERVIRYAKRLEAELNSSDNEFESTNEKKDY